MKYEAEFTLLTFYKFVDVADPEAEVADHLIFCNDIGMKGRIYIGSEGISSTVTCNQWQLRAYKSYLDQHELFNNPSDLDIKACKVDAHKFPRMSVKLREEIVSLWKKYTAQEIEQAGNRMWIEEFKDILDWDTLDDYIILDMRNNHEYKLGHFKNAIPANTLNFRELEKEIQNYKKDFWDKKIISYCTGGIRCEKSTVMLQKAGLKNTYQLDWGVVKYVNTYNDGNWEGNLYVFDDRVSAPVGDANTHTTIGECIYSGEKTNNCENCRYSACNARIIAKPGQYKDHFGFCSQDCANDAVEHILIKQKEVAFDSMKYKDLRGKIKSKPELKQEIESQMRKHIQDKLKWVRFNHIHSQKEEFVMD